MKFVICSSIAVLGLARLALAAKIRITSLVPFTDDMEEAISGKYSSFTSNLQRKLTNVQNFGPYGIVKVDGIDYDEIDLHELKADEEGRKVVRQKLQNTDILYWAAIDPNDYYKFYQLLVPYVQNGSVTLLMLVDYTDQGKYAEAFGYSVEASTAGTWDVKNFNGPFGRVPLIQSKNNVVKFKGFPPYSKRILENSDGDATGFEEDTKIIIGDGNVVLNDLLTERSHCCQRDRQSIFICNVFAKLIVKSQGKKPRN